MPPEQPTVVAIPVCNEQFHLKACIDSLLAQTIRADSIVLLLNNCTDGSRNICRDALQLCTTLKIIECNLYHDQASAGEARRRALDYAQIFAADGVVLTTDADSTVPMTWIADNLAAIGKGADCVCGMAVVAPLGWGENQRRVEFEQKCETRLLSLHDEIAAIVDPDASDPWPRHQHNSGASLAMRAAMLRRAGGAPRIASGEDRALVAKLALYDAKIRHAPGIQVQVSGRLQGRATGGMADTISRRLRRQDRLTDEMLEPTVDAYRRVLTRLRLRDLRNGATTPGTVARLSTDLLIPPDLLVSALPETHFGTAWQTIQRASPMLRRRRIAFLDLARETRQALALRDHLRATLEPHQHKSVWEDFRHAL